MTSFPRALILGGVIVGIGSSSHVAAIELVSGTFSQGKARLWTGHTPGIVDSTKVGFGWLKNLRIVPFFFIFAFLSRFALDSMQIFVPRCRFSRFGSPTMLQCMQALQSRHSAYPCASRTAWFIQKRL